MLTNRAVVTVARGLSPFNVESVAFEAGRLMLQRIDYLMNKGVDFALETTLSTRSYVQTIQYKPYRGPGRWAMW